jgi:peptide/nickel transport system permease protein
VRVRAYYCLDRGIVGQYGCYVDHLAHGSLGESYRSKRSVGSIIADRTWPTVQLALAAILLQLLIGVPLGVLAAVRRNRWPDHAANVIGLIGQSAPTFFIGTLLLYLVAYRWGWFPIGGYGDGFIDRVRHLVLPATTLAAVGVAYYARVVRSEMVEVLAEDYVRTARAKGLSERTVIGRHALRNALGPLVTLVGLDLGVLLGGAIVTEYIFAWPGLGREVLQAILEVDNPLILGVVLVSAIAIAFANLLVDIVYLWIDPRLRDG